MVKVQLRGAVPQLCTAQSKAPDDVADIVARCGFRTVLVHPFASANPLLWRIGRLLAWLTIPLVGWRVPRESVLFVQYPDSYQGRIGVRLLRWIKRHRAVRIVMLIHDLPTLRYQSAADLANRAPEVNENLSFADVIIVHNRRMLDWMAEHGTERSKMLSIDLFDYLTEAPLSPEPVDAGLRRSIAIPGYLALSSSGFLAKLHEIQGIEWQLYGVAFEADKVAGSNVHYHGSFSPEKLPSQMKCGFGLIWYGSSIDACDGFLGRYVQYINPHKLSLFMASGIPVIVWNRSAMADFVRVNAVGLVVNSLREVPQAIEALSDAEYAAMRANALRLSASVRAGRFTRTALECALERLEQSKSAD